MTPHAVRGRTQEATMFEVTGTQFTVRDIEGNALCHSPAQNKSACNSARRRGIIGAWETALTEAGMMTGTEALCADGVWRDRGKGQDERDGYADAGHIVADSLNGAFCGCNFVPLEGKQNREDGDAMPVISSAWNKEAYGVAWRKVALATMTKSKASRAV